MGTKASFSIFHFSLVIFIELGRRFVGVGLSSRSDIEALLADRY